MKLVTVPFSVAAIILAGLTVRERAFAADDSDIANSCLSDGNVDSTSLRADALPGSKSEKVSNSMNERDDVGENEPTDHSPALADGVFSECEETHAIVNRLKSTLIQHVRCDQS